MNHDPNINETTHYDVNLLILQEKELRVMHNNSPYIIKMYQSVTDYQNVNIFPQYNTVYSI